jgi:hypothetical protein
MTITAERLKMQKSASIRKAKERERKREKGLVPQEVWVKVSDVPKLKAFLADLATDDERQDQQTVTG